MSILINLVAGAVHGIRGVLTRTPKKTLVRTASTAGTDEFTKFAPVMANGAGPGARDDVGGDEVLALRSSNEEPRPGDGGTLPGTALPGPGTYPTRAYPASTPEVPQAEVFIDANAARDILGDVDWDVLAGDDAVRILGDDGHLFAPDVRRS